MKSKSLKWVVDHWREGNDKFSSRLTALDNPSFHAADLKLMVQTGNASVSNLFDGKNHVGMVVFSIDHQEIAILALFVDPVIEKALQIALPYVQSLGKKNGCKTVRFNTARLGMVNETMKDGFDISEVVMRKKIQ